jgi:asparagine synthetase B (glutamine-hydrolysing)
MSSRPRLSPLDVACGLVFGEEVGALKLPAPLPGGPRAALEAAVVEALARPPCLVSFSGGRDSSAVLAIATHLARREGLGAPIPATNRFPDVASSDELEWQERVVRHLGLGDWERVLLTDELDCVGPIAQDTLRRHGLLWPFNAYFHVPLLRHAAGGSLLTGVGGDEAFATSQWARVRLLSRGAVRPRPRDALSVALALAPKPLKVQFIRRRRIPANAFPWLQQGAQQAAENAAAAEAAAEPLRWRRGFEWKRRLRHMEVSLDSLQALGAAEDVTIAHPLSDRRLWAALADLPVEERFQSRTEAMRRYFGDLLPEPILVRSTKASFDEVFWNHHSRAFAQSWNGGGVEPDVVDVEALRREWASPAPSPRSFLLAQAAWLNGSTSRDLAPNEVDQRVGSGV